MGLCERSRRSAVQAWPMPGKPRRNRRGAGIRLSTAAAKICAGIIDSSHSAHTQASELIVGMATSSSTRKPAASVMTAPRPGTSRLRSALATASFQGMPAR